MAARRPPGPAKHLPPLGRGVHGDLDALEIDPATLTRRLLGVRSRLGRLLSSGQDAQALASAIDERACVRRETEVSDAVDQGLVLLFLEVVDLQCRPGGGDRVEPVLIPASLHGNGGEERLVLEPHDTRVAPFWYWKRDDTPLDAVEVDAQGLRLGRLVVLLGSVLCLDLRS